MKHLFKITFVSTADCFFYLNAGNIRKLTKNGELNGNCLKIEFGIDFGSSTYCALSSRTYDIADDSIGLNAIHANLLGIKENDEVFISLANAPLISKVHVRAEDERQYQLIVQNGNLLENTILEQAKIVTVGETIPVRVFSNVIINLKIEKLYPVSKYGELQQRTEMVILSPDEEIKDTSRRKSVEWDDSNSNVPDPVKTMFCKLFSVFSQGDSSACSSVKRMDNHFSFASLIQKSKTPSSEEKLSKLCDGNNPLMLRVVPSYFAPKKIQKMIENNVAVASRQPNATTFKDPRWCIISKIETHQLPSNKINFPQLPQSSMYVYVVTCDDNYNKCLPSDVLYVSDYCMERLHLKFGSGVLIEEVKQQRNLMLEIDRDLFCASVKEKHCFTEGVKKIYDDVLRTVTDNIRVNQKVNTLITGNTGSGKTYLLNALSGEFARLYLSCTRMECKALRRLKASSLEKKFRENLSQCCKTTPSVMIIDDLDALTMEDEEGNPYNAMYSARVGAMIVELITSYQKINEITFIATGTNLTRFKDFSTDRGPLVFENIHEIGELQTSERSYLLRSIIYQGKLAVRISDSLVEEIGSKTKGYNVQDLIDLMKIADFKRLSRIDSDEGEITREDFESALAEKIPLSLYGVNLEKKAMTRWEDIGGMEETKNLLKEMFEWPLRYHELYASCPLRLQCGVLLYGAPGTGKTLIAGAVANEFGLNFISIKGPEVFSKYVGASEQGVRDLFARAKRAKPCVLFFDEFDSLARKRGSSNEDVNDRVVNQLLTELDGVEELTGVFILAATSRPDLLDPALLRPGRIDRTVHCKLPTQVERLSILKALSKNMKLSDDVQLEELAAKTDGYSGADLQAVLYAAQMLLVKEVGKLKATNPQEGLTLKQRHLLTGLAETKPSTSKEDRENYDSSYEAFVASRSGRSIQQLGYTQQKIMFA